MVAIVALLTIFRANFMGQVTAFLYVSGVLDVRHTGIRPRRWRHA